jgi:putative GTP pyrophosphokinase
MADRQQVIVEAEAWYGAHYGPFDSLAKKVEKLIDEVLLNERIGVHSISSRPKSIESFKRKSERYDSPQTQIHDLAGIRVITYVETDSTRVAAVIESLFDVDHQCSGNKSKELGTDKVGYRSDHYVCCLPADRCKLREYKQYENIRFEIQVRTILQHAWAEIQHDRNYKFGGELPAEFKRRFALLAASLEIADREFDRIVHEIDDYAGSVTNDTAAGRLQIPIDSISIRAYLMEMFSSKIALSKIAPIFVGDDDASVAVNELRRFGLSTIEELDRLIPADLVDKVDKTNLIGLVRLILIAHDADRYFTSVWDRLWGFGADRIEYFRRFGVDIKILSEKYGVMIHF